MFVVCNGMPRSASTWSFNVAVAILRAVDPGALLHTGYNEDPAAFLAQAPPGVRQIVLKCHSLPPLLGALADAGAAKLIYTFRDIADAAVSFMTMFGADFEHALAVMDGALDQLHAHGRGGRALIIDYADIVADPGMLVARIGKHLDVALTGAEIAAIAEEMSLARMRAKTPPPENAGHGDRLIRHENNLYDPETLLNVGHIRDGRIGSGRERLDAAQLDRIVALLRRYGMTMPQPETRSGEAS
jgi:Sulfotransferase family